MTVAADLAALSPTLLVTAEGGSPRASNGVLSHTGVTVVPGLGGQVLRVADGEVRVTLVPDVTANRRFTFLAWFRGTPRASTRRLVGRENGSTWVLLEVGSDGLPAVRVASTQGGWSIRVPGGTRVDDGQWHLVAATGTVRTTLGGLLDTGGVNVDLWVDDALTRSGYIDPGLFGQPVDLRMTGPVVLGRSAGGSSPLHGDLGPVALYPRALSAATLAGLWDGRPDTQAAYSGWGIPLG